MPSFHKHRHEVQPERISELGCRGEGEIDVVIQELCDVWRGYFHSADEFGLRHVELNHSVDGAADETGGESWRLRSFQRLSCGHLYWALKGA